jgi:hypothetical protein
MSDNVFYLMTSIKYQQTDKYKLINRQNEDIFPTLDLSNITPVREYEALYQLWIKNKESHNDNYIFMSEQGVLYAEGME